MQLQIKTKLPTQRWLPRAFSHLQSHHHLCQSPQALHWMYPEQIQNSALQPYPYPIFQTHREKRNATKLLKAFWQAKVSGHNATMQWSIVDRATAYRLGTRYRNLCLTEKFTILLANQNTALNKRSELTGRCRHKNKFKLKNICS